MIFGDNFGQKVIGPGGTLLVMKKKSFYGFKVSLKLIFGVNI